MASPPLIAITATKKKAKEPKARIAAPEKVVIAMIVTPAGRFIVLNLRSLPWSQSMPHRPPAPHCMLRTGGATLSFRSHQRQDSLVRMAVAPFPVIPLLFLLEFVVLFPVLFVPLLQIMPVGAILAFVPVVIVLVVPIVNSYLDVLRRPGGRHRTSGRKSSR